MTIFVTLLASNGKALSVEKLIPTLEDNMDKNSFSLGFRVRYKTIK